MASDTLPGLLGGTALLCKSKFLAANDYFHGGGRGSKVALCKSETMTCFRMGGVAVGGGGVSEALYKFEILTEHDHFSFSGRGE